MTVALEDPRLQPGAYIRTATVLYFVIGQRRGPPNMYSIGTITLLVENCADGETSSLPISTARGLTLVRAAEPCPAALPRAWA